MGRTFAAAACSRFRLALALAVLPWSAAVVLALPDPAAAHHAKRPHAPPSLRVLSTTESAVAVAWKRTSFKSVLTRNLRRVAVTSRTRFVFRSLECDRAYRLGVRALARSGDRSRAAIRLVNGVREKPKWVTQGVVVAVIAGVQLLVTPR